MRDKVRLVKRDRPKVFATCMVPAECDDRTARHFPLTSEKKEAISMCNMRAWCLSLVLDAGALTDLLAPQALPKHAHMML